MVACLHKPAVCFQQTLQARVIWRPFGFRPDLTIKNFCLTLNLDDVRLTVTANPWPWLLAISMAALRDEALKSRLIVQGAECSG